MRMEGNNDNHEEPLTSPIIMQTHAYFMSPPAASTTDQRDVQRQSEEEETSDQQPQVLNMLAFEAEALSPAAAATEDDAAQRTLPANNSDIVPAIERSGTSATEGTEDYSNPSSPASAPSTPTRGTSIKQRPAATPAGPAERTRRDDKLSMLYTPVKGDKHDADVSLEDGMDDFMENEYAYEKRKYPCNWVVWAALVVFIGGALVITGVVVYNKKQAAAAASLLHQNGGAPPKQPEEDAIVPVMDPPTPTSSPSAKITEDASPPVELESFDQLDPEDLLGEDEAISTETVGESYPVDDSSYEEIVTTSNATPGDDNDEHDASILPEITSSPTITNDEPTMSPTIDPYLDLGGTQEAPIIPEEMTIQEKTKPDQSDEQLSKEPTTSVTITRDKITYRPGDLTVSMNGLLLSAGLTAQMIAKSGKPVMYKNGKTSDSDFHSAPDFGGVFPLENGGWIYASNSEVDNGKGGVGAITFDSDGKVIHYEKLLKGTSMNCGGGKSPWGTWISCEELNNEGQVWEVDPTGKNNPKKTVLGGQGGRFESFSYDIRNKDYPRFFVTEDKFNGPLRRFTPDPSEIDWNHPSKMLYGKGTMEYLVLLPDKSPNATKGQGSFTWTKHVKVGKESAMELFPNVEGIDVANGELFFVSKRFQEMTVLDLDTNQYRTTSTVRGLFDGKPDQIQRITDGDGLLFFTEEGGVDAGVHARDSEGRFYTILESPVWKAETTGLAFSPDNKHMYVAYQANGLLFDVTRTDGLPFDGRSINAKFHKMALDGNGDGEP